MGYTISRFPNLLRITVSDVVTLHDCIRSVDGLLAEGTLRPGMQILIDATDLDPRLSSNDIRDLVRHADTLAKHGLSNIAIIAAGDFVYGLARMFSIYAYLHGLEIAAFRTQENASTWLESCKLVGTLPRL